MTARGGSGLRDRATSRRAIRAYGLFVVALIVLFAADASRQPTSGPGWQILGYQRSVAGTPDVVMIPTQEALDAAWDRLLVRKAAPALPGNATTFWITATGSLGCPAHFAGFVTDETKHSIAANFTLALTSGCDTLRVPDSFLVAIDNDRLPPRPFQFLRMGPQGQPQSAVEIAP